MAVFFSCIAYMGSIGSVLSVLKMAGIIVGIVILVFVIIAACLLFVPVRYEGRGNIESKVYDVKIYWFLRIVQFCFHSSDGSMDYCIRLFGKRTRFLDKDFLKARKEKKAKKKRKKEAKQARKKEREKQRFKKKRDKKKKNIQLDTELPNDDIQSGSSAEVKECAQQYTDSTGKNIQNPRMQTDNDTEHFEESEDNTISEESKKAPSKLKKIWHTLTNVLKLMNEYHPLALVWPGLQKLLYHIRPRLLKADLVFGFTDPSMTGKVLGAVSNLYFLYQYEKFHLNGDFETENTYIEGTFLVKGHIRGIYLLIFFIGLIRQRDFRRFLKALKKSKNGGVS